MGIFSERRQRKVLRAEENDGKNAFGWFVVLVVFGGLAVSALGEGQEVNPAIGLVLWVVALFALVRILQGMSRSTHAKKVEKASQAPRGRRAVGSSTPDPARTRAAKSPKLTVGFLKPGEFPSLPNRVRRVKESENVVGRPALRIAYFRMFANPSRSRTFLESAWREFGYVHLLRSADSVTQAEFRKRSTGRFFVEDDDDFADLLRHADRKPLRPGARAITGVAPKPIKVRDPYGSYPVFAIPCHVDFWRRAVDLLLEQADLVVVDLSGFTRRNAGTAYELQRVIDMVPIERVVLLCDPKSDRRFLQSTIQESWSQMSPRSPNAIGNKRQVRCGITDHFRTIAVRSGDQVGGYEELRSNRKESRRLAAAAVVVAEGAARTH